MKRIRKCFVFATMASVLLTVAIMAKPIKTQAVSMDYEGEITPEMLKEEQNSSSNTNKNSKDRVLVADGIKYDNAEKCYVYSTSAGEVYSSAMDGMMLQDSVALTFEKGINYLIMKDGEECKLSNNKLSDTGNYTISVSENGDMTKIFSFTIVGKSVGADILSYELPSTFYATSFTFNGSDALEDVRTIELSEQGKYNLTYYSPRVGKNYSLSFEVDREAPTLKLPGVKNGTIRGPLDISDYNSADTITITRNGKEIRYNKILSNCGKYVITLSDAAGNTTVYTVFVAFYFNIQTVSFIIIVFLIIIGIIVYIRISKKKFRVR